MFTRKANLDSVPSSKTAKSFFSSIFKGSLSGSETVGGQDTDLSDLLDFSNYSNFQEAVKNLLEVKSSRDARYREYEMMDDDTLPSRSLDIFASLITQGELDEDETAAGYKIVTSNDSQRKIFEDMEIRTNLRKNLYSKIRTLCKYGINPQELVFQEYVGISKIRIILPSSFSYYDEGNPGSGEYAYIQGDKSGNPLAKFYKYQVVPFTIGGDETRIYGKSVLEPVRKTWKIIEVLELAIVLRELNRAMQKWLWLIDCTGMNKEEAKAYSKKIMQTYQKMKFVDSAGKFSLSQNLFKDFGDIALPTYDNKAQVDIRSLPTDPTSNSSGNGSVLQHYISKYFGGIGIPNYYFSYEGAKQIRSAAAMNYSDLILAKMIYRMQTEIVSSMWDIYQRESEFHGISDTDFKLVLPVVSTVDDLRKYQVMNLKIQIAKALRMDLRMVDDQWVYEFLKFGSKNDSRLKIFRKAIRLEEKDMLQAAADGVFLQPISTMGNIDEPSPFDVDTPARQQREGGLPSDPFADLSKNPQESALLQEKILSERTFREFLSNSELRKGSEDFLELMAMKRDRKEYENLSSSISDN